MGLDMWIFATKFLPPKSFIRMSIENIMTELPDADPQLAFLTMCALLGHKINGTIEMGGNNFLKTTLYVGVVGPSGSGKSSTISLALSRLGLRALGTRTSAEGLARVLAEKPEEGVIHFADEVHQMLSNVSGYLADVIDVWKTLYNRTDYILERRNVANSIVVPGNAKLTVFWTTTEEDLETVLNNVSSAWIRRSFVVPVSKSVSFFKPSRQASWNVVRGMYEAVGEIKFRFVIDDEDGELYRLENEMKKKMLPYVNCPSTEIGEKAVRLATILAVDQLLATALHRVEKEYRTDLLGVNEIKERVKDAILSIARGEGLTPFEYSFTYSENVTNGTNEKQTQQNTDILYDERETRNFNSSFNNSFNTHSTPPSTLLQHTRDSRMREPPLYPLKEGVRAWCFTRVVEGVLKKVLNNLLKKVLNELLKFDSYSNEESIINRVLIGDVFRITTNPQVISQALTLVAIAHSICAREPPSVRYDGREGVVIVNIPPSLVKTAILVVLANLMSSLRIKGWLGYDPEWGYFLRRLYELADKNDGVVTLRKMCMYMKRLGKIETIKSYLMRAIYAGIIEPENEEDLNMIRSTTPLRVKYPGE